MSVPEGGMEHKLAEEGMEAGANKEQVGHGQELHEAAYDGQVGMARAAMMDGTDLHLEIASDAPGQYRLYLSGQNREPVSPEGYQGTLAVIEPNGSEIAIIPLTVEGDHLVAEGGPTDLSQMDVRLRLEGPNLTDILEMDFTLSYTQ
jgi:hypothetical protein